MPRRFRRAVALGGKRTTEEGQRPMEETARSSKREYMRRWRSDPAHQAQERERRLERYYDRKLRILSDDGETRTEACPDGLCGFCHRLPSITEVQRLVVSGMGKDGYVPILVPYCGTC